jgi:hypothetical protein
MSDEFKRELQEIGRRLKARREAKLNAQQDQLSDVEDAIQHWEKGIASDIKQVVEEANTALAEAGVSLACVEGTAGPVDGGERVGSGIPKTLPKMTITIMNAGGAERVRTTNKQLEFSVRQDGYIAVLPFQSAVGKSNFSLVEIDKDEIQALILAFVRELDYEDDGGR